MVLVCIDVDLLELANLNLFRQSELKSRLRIEPVPVGAHSVRLELFLAKGNAERNRELLVGTFGEHELFRRAADQPRVVQNLSLNDSVVLISSESASSFVSIVGVEALAGDLNISVTIIRTGSWLHAADSVWPIKDIT